MGNHLTGTCSRFEMVAGTNHVYRYTDLLPYFSEETAVRLALQESPVHRGFLRLSAFATADKRRKRLRSPAR